MLKKNLIFIYVGILLNSYCNWYFNWDASYKNQSLFLAGIFPFLRVMPLIAMAHLTTLVKTSRTFKVEEETLILFLILMGKTLKSLNIKAWYLLVRNTNFHVCMKTSLYSYFKKKQKTGRAFFYLKHSKYVILSNIWSNTFLYLIA